MWGTFCLASLQKSSSISTTSETRVGHGVDHRVEDGYPTYEGASGDSRTDYIGRKLAMIAVLRAIMAPRQLVSV